MTDYSMKVAQLTQRIGEVCHGHEDNLVFEAIAINLANMVQDLEVEEAIPLLLEVMQDAVMIAFEVDTSIVPMGKMQ
jgi:hypothetical protein